MNFGKLGVDNVIFKNCGKKLFGFGVENVFWKVWGNFVILWIVFIDDGPTGWVLWDCVGWWAWVT